MIPGSANSLLLTSSGDDGYEIEKSLRFSSGDSAYLGKTFSSAGSLTTWTLSFWIKRAKGGGNKAIFMSYNGSSIDEPNYANINFNSSEQLVVGYAWASYKTTNRVFKDFSSWYHILIRLETGNSTASDRVQIYVNGVKETSFASTHDPDQNQSLAWNNAYIHRIGSEYNQQYNDCYFAEVHFIDGQALAPTDFGEFDSNNVWQPKKYSGTYGTNGFYLNFADNSSVSALGTDTSGNSNNFTVNNLSIATTSANVIQFDGNDYVQFDGPGTVSGDFTMEAFVKHTSTSPAQQRVIGANEQANGEYTMIRLSSGSYVSYVGDTNGYCNHSEAGVLPANQWHHVAVSRSGSTVSYYINGSRVSTDTFSNSFTWTKINLASGYNNELLTGNIYGGRVVIGQALYTGASYTVPTSAVTTTSQGATASNVVVLAATSANVNTNLGTASHDSTSGDPTVVTDYPFGSPAGNDSLTDTPTNYGDDTGLGGEVRGNYATLNPLSAGSRVTLSNGNLELASTAASGQAATMEALATFTASSGKFYAEATGMSNRVISLSSGDYFNGVHANVYSGGASNTLGGTASGSGASFGTSDVMGIAVDFTNKNVYFYKNNTLIYSVTGYTTTETLFIADRADSSGSNGSSIWNFGQRPFTYTAPSGYKALCTQNLDDPLVEDDSKYFDTKLYDGSSSAQTISGLNFSPDLVWIKTRSTTEDHYLFDEIRGVQKWMSTNNRNADATNANSLTSFNSDGFTVGTASGSNWNGRTFVSWNWDAGSSTVTNTNGTLSAQVRANPSAGFSIVNYVGNGVQGASFAHGLNAVPEMVITKCRDSLSDWAVFHTSLGVNWTLQMHLTSAANNWTDSFPAVDSNTVTVGNWNAVNTNNQNMLAYCFTGVEGYSKFGKYTGNGSADGPFIYTGFRPKWILVKASSSVTYGNWLVHDTSRAPSNVSDKSLYANLGNAEDTTYSFDILSNGFKIRSSAYDAHNGNGSTYIFAAFGHPFKTSRAR